MVPKILDSIPESLRPQLIAEVKELIKEEENKANQDKVKKDDLKREIDHIVDQIM